MSQQTRESNNSKPERYNASHTLPQDLQKLIDQEELYRDSSGDFENSWTTTHESHVPSMMWADITSADSSKQQEGKAQQGNRP